MICYNHQCLFFHEGIITFSSAVLAIAPAGQQARREEEGMLVFERMRK
jgi:hypothetical protein